MGEECTIVVLRDIDLKYSERERKKESELESSENGLKRYMFDLTEPPQKLEGCPVMLAGIKEMLLV